MAEERVDHDGNRIVKARISPWRLSAEEGALIDTAPDLPNWRLADKARRMAADFCVHFSAQMPPVADLELGEIDASVSRQWAVITAVGIEVRSASAAMMLIASGYLPESGSMARRMIEAALNVQAVLADKSGQYAVRYLQGKSRKLSKLASQFGSPEEIRLLSILAHADARALALASDGPPVGAGGVKESTVSLLPGRDTGRAHDHLYAIAYECGKASTGLAEVFDVAVEIPPWMNGELIRLRALNEERRAADGTVSRSD